MPGRINGESAGSPFPFVDDFGRFLYVLVISRLRGLFIAYMSRSLKKGPFVDFKLLKKISTLKPSTAGVVKTWARRSQISPEMIGFTFGVHNGRQHVEVLVAEEMVGHRLGEFSPTKKFFRHGGKMQKEMEAKKQEAEIASAKRQKRSLPPQHLRNNV